MTKNGFKFAGVPVFSRAFVLWVKDWAKHYLLNLRKPKDIDELIERHFKYWSETKHRTRPGLEMGLKYMNSPRLIVETGTSAWGCDSSRLLDMYARFYGAEFLSVDIRPEASEWLRLQTSDNTHFYVDDSIHFLQSTFPKLFNKTIDFAYLDSFDLDLANPTEAEDHCLQEFVAVLNYARQGTVIVIDDTRASVEEFPVCDQQIAANFFHQTGRIPGKGSLVLEKIRHNSNFKVVWHRENLVIKVLIDSPKIQYV